MGPEETVFTIHADLVTRFLKTLIELLKSLEIAQSIRGRKKGRKRGNTQVSKEQKLWDAFEQRDLQVPEGKARSEMVVFDRHMDMYLCHLRLYVFANAYHIAPLAQLCLSRLYRA